LLLSDHSRQELVVCRPGSSFKDDVSVLHRYLWSPAQISAGVCGLMWYLIRPWVCVRNPMVVV